MSKGILILDEMPENCSDCPEWEPHDDWGNYIGRCSIKDGCRSRTVGIPLWCPLKEIPEHLTVVEAAKKGNVTGCVSEMDAWRKGWNDCLKEIMGDDEDE